METIEIWAPLPLPGASYEVSTHGRVRSIPRAPYKQRYLAMHINRQGAPTFRIACERNGVPAMSFLSAPKLIAETFPHLVPNPDSLPLLAFRDGDERNCAVENLYWVDYARREVQPKKAKVPRPLTPREEKSLYKKAQTLADQQRWWSSMSYAEQQDMLTKGQPMKGVLLKEKDDE